MQEFQVILVKGRSESVRLSMIASLKFQQFHQVSSERATRFGQNHQVCVNKRVSWYTRNRMTSDMSRQGQWHVWHGTSTCNELMINAIFVASAPLPISFSQSSHDKKRNFPGATLLTCIDSSIESDGILILSALTGTKCQNHELSMWLVMQMKLWLQQDSPWNLYANIMQHRSRNDYICIPTWLRLRCAKDFVGGLVCCIIVVLYAPWRKKRVPFWRKVDKLSIHSKAGL